MGIARTTPPPQFARGRYAEKVLRTESLGTQAKTLQSDWLSCLPTINLKFAMAGARQHNGNVFWFPQLFRRRLENMTGYF